MPEEAITELLRRFKSVHLLGQVISSGGMAVVFGIAMIGFFYLADQRERTQRQHLEDLQRQWEKRLDRVEENVGAVYAATGGWGAVINKHSVQLDEISGDLRSVRLQVESTVELVSGNGEHIKRIQTLGTGVTDGLRDRIRRIETGWQVR